MEWFRKRKKKEPIRRADCQAHISDPQRGILIETWFIGDDGEVDRKTYDQLKDEKGHLYVLVYYTDRERVAHIVPKPYWEKAMEAYRFKARPR